LKAKRVKAWACGFCSNTYYDKQRADLCCLCPVCKVNASTYTGLGTRCQSCHQKKALEDMRETLEAAQKNYDRALKASRR